MVFIRRNRVKSLWILGLGIGLCVVSFFLLSEYVWGYEPCHLCEWQRYPWYGSVVVCAVGVVWGEGRVLIGMVLYFLLVMGGSLGFYHAGVEYGFWMGPSSCTSGLPLVGGADAIRDYLLGRGFVPCDRASWTLWGVSMAGYNGLVSYGMAGFMMWRYVRRGVVV